MNKKGFTVIELLVVVAVVALLSSVIFTSVSSAREKAEDVKMKKETNSVKQAIEAYRIDYNTVPLGNNANLSESQTYLEGSLEYQGALQELVDEGYLSAVPQSHDESSYAYIVSADGTEAAFAANLNRASSNNPESNSCEFMENEIVPQIPGPPSFPSPPSPPQVFLCDQNFADVNVYAEVGLGNFYRVDTPASISCNNISLEGHVCSVTDPGSVAYPCGEDGYQSQTNLLYCETESSIAQPGQYTCTPIPPSTPNQPFGSNPICKGLSDTEYCACI